MDVLLGKIYSFDEKVKDSTACVRECGNKFRLIKIHIDVTPFQHDQRDVRFEFLCQQCGSTIFLALQLEVDKFHPIVERDRIEGIHLSFWLGQILNFDYTDAEDKKEGYASSLGKEKKKSINPNRIFRDRKRKSSSSFRYTRPPAREMNAFDVSFIPEDQIVQRNIDAGGKVVVEYIKRNDETIVEFKTEFPSAEMKKVYSEKYASLARHYARPEDMYEKSEELVDLTIPEELTIPIPQEGGWIRSKKENEMGWKEGKAINWETVSSGWAEKIVAQTKVGKGVIEPEKSVEQKMKGDVPSDLEYDEFFDYDDYDNDTSIR